jgi:hypothetical protein
MIIVMKYGMISEILCAFQRYSPWKVVSIRRFSYGREARASARALSWPIRKTLPNDTAISTRSGTQTSSRALRQGYLIGFTRDVEFGVVFMEA